jgi:altronate dehydratase small subunit
VTKALLVKQGDNVATSLERLARGEQVSLAAGGEALEVRLAEDIAFGHKFAVRAIAAGEPIVKYAETIGLATRAIAPGEWVHVHNVESVRARGDRAPGGSR